MDRTTEAERIRARIPALDLAYAELNARKSVGSLAESEFRVERFGEVVATFDAARTDPYYDRILGLHTADVDRAREVLSLYDDLPALRVDLAPAGLTPRLVDLLLEKGLRPVASLVYLGAELPRMRRSWSADGPERLGGPEENAKVAAGLAVAEPADLERWGEDRADAFLDLLELEGGPIDSKIRAARRPYLCTDTFRVFVATRDGAPVAWATTFIHEDAAFFGNANTLAEHRRQGLQGALFHARLQDAELLGARCVVTDVEAGTESARNAERAGLAMVSTYSIWQRPAA